ncbi:MAG: aminotransferase class IV [Pirellulales bacterium]
MSERVCYFNGRLIPERNARVSIFDSALQVGDMAFEVTRTYHGRPFRLRDHLDRLWASMTALRIDAGLTQAQLEEITQDVLGRNRPTEAGDVDWTILHDVSRGPAAGFRSHFAAEELCPTVIVACYPLAEKIAKLAPAYETGIDLIVPEQRSLPQYLLSAGIKCRSRVHYQLANLQAEAKLPGSTALLLDPDGYLTEGTTGNIFVVREGELLTPTTRNILPGVTRRTVLELATELNLPTRETDITLGDAQRSHEAFVTSTSIGILHARSLNERPIGDGRLGPITVRLREALTQRVGLDFAAQAASYAARLSK